MLVVESSDGEQGASSAIDVQDQYLSLESEEKQEELQMEVQQKRKLPALKRKRKDLSPDSEDDRAPSSSKITKNGPIGIDFSDDEQTLGELVPQKKAEEGASTAPDSDDFPMDQGAFFALSLVIALFLISCDLYLPGEVIARSETPSPTIPPAPPPTVEDDQAESAHPSDSEASFFLQRATSGSSSTADDKGKGKGTERDLEPSSNSQAVASSSRPLAARLNGKPGTSSPLALFKAAAKSKAANPLGKPPLNFRPVSRPAPKPVVEEDDGGDTLFM